MDQPVLIYDGRCGFCKLWIDYFRRRTGDRVNYAPSQDVGPSYPQIVQDEFKQAVQLVRPDGSYVSGAEAVFELLGTTWAYRHIPGFRAIS
jgi:predicted DCC family thiol-disulfide oxidoreductase YuxK